MIRLTVPAIGDDEVDAVERVLRSGMLVHGAEGEAFEKELAAYLGCADVVTVSSGTAALHLALLALDVGPGDAVLVPDFTFPATANAVVAAGARPVFADVDPTTYNVTPATLRAAAVAFGGPGRLRAVVPVHEFGAPADMAGINALAAELGLAVVEDAACAFGTLAGDVHAGLAGDVGCFSFHPRKALTTGEGGALVAKDPGVLRRLRRLRNHGIEPSPAGLRFVEAGLNYRLTDFQSALGRVQLAKFDGYLEARAELQRAYREALALLPIAFPADAPGHAWQTFMVVLADGVDRAGVIAGLRSRGVEANLGAQCLHALDAFRELLPADCARLAGNTAERLYERGLALPLYPGLTQSDVAVVARALGETLGAAA